MDVYYVRVMTGIRVTVAYAGSKNTDHIGNGYT